MLAPRSIIGNGNKQGPPTLLVTLPQPKGGYMHLALMNCHEHLLAQKLFETSRSKQLSFRFLSSPSRLGIWEQLRIIKRLSYALTTANSFPLLFFARFPPFLFFFFPISESIFFSFLHKIQSLYPRYRRILFDRSIDTRYRKRYWILCSSIVPVFHRIVTFQLGAQLAQCTTSRALLLFFLVHIFANDHRTFCIISTTPQRFFRTMDRFFHIWDSFWRYFVSKIFSQRQERVRKRRNERKTQLPRLSGIFPWGNSNVTVYRIPPLYPFTIRSILSSALSRGRKNRHGLTFSKRETPDSSTDSRHFSFHASSYLFHCCRHEKYLLMYRRRNWGGDAFLRQFITRAGSLNLFEHLIYHSWNVNWYLKMLYHDYFWLKRNG